VLWFMVGSAFVDEREGRRAKQSFVCSVVQAPYLHARGFSKSENFARPSLAREDECEY
jgi:hypothetical protein